MDSQWLFPTAQRASAKETQRLPNFIHFCPVSRPIHAALNSIRHRLPSQALAAHGFKTPMDGLFHLKLAWGRPTESRGFRARLFFFSKVFQARPIASKTRMDSIEVGRAWPALL